MNLRNKISFFLILISLVAVFATGLLVLQNAINDKKNYVTELNSVLSPQITNVIDQKLKNLISNLGELNNHLHKPNDAATALKNFKNRSDGVIAVFIKTRENKLLSYMLTDAAVTGDQLNILSESLTKLGNTQLTTGKLTYLQDKLFLTAFDDKTFGAVLLNEEFFKDAFELARGKPSMLVTDKKEILYKSGLKNDSAKLLQKVPAEVWSRNELISLELQDEQRQNHLFNFSRNHLLNDSFVVLIVPQATWQELTAPILKSSFGLIVLLIIFSVLIAYSISHSLAKPIEELSELTSQVGKGEWQKIVIAGSGAEILKLTKAFNTMIENLKNREQDLKIAQNKIIQARSLAAIGRMGAGVAHEVKNPLSSILGYGQLIEMKIAGHKDGASDPRLLAQIREYVNLLLDDTRRASRIISDLLMFSRQKNVQTEKLDLISTLQSFETKLQAACETHRIDFLMVPPTAQNVQVMIDTDQFYQVVFNLVQNAIHALADSTAEYKSIKLQTSVSNNYTEITVTDNGPGISEENIKKVFEPFFSTKKVGEGTGLGLALCYGIVEQHGGTIDVTSEPGVRTSFKIRLPLAD